MTTTTTIPQDHHIALRGLTFHYRDWGGPAADTAAADAADDGADRPILLLHGLASTCHIWDLVAPLLASDYPVIALDQRGHGQSAQVDDGYDFATVSADAAAFIDAIGWQRPLIIGHSWGADVALELAAAQPQIAAGLIFVDGGMIEPSARPGWTLEQARIELAPPVFTDFTPAMMRERIITSARFGPNPPDAVIDAILANFHTLPDGTIQSNLRRENHLRIIDALWEHHPSQLYPTLQCPVLLLPARQPNPDASDRRFRREESIARAASLLPNSRTTWLENSIHDVPLQHPELVASAIRDQISAGFFNEPR